MVSTTPQMDQLLDIEDFNGRIVEAYDKETSGAVFRWCPLSNPSVSLIHRAGKDQARFDFFPTGK
ncbi:TPA: hypothetical protein DCE37_11265 [Candidatus Latescibacteria bacterium]|nr:hypothetical protein [Candidatus Latescibacterota bacterium]